MAETEEQLFRALYWQQARQGSGVARHASVGEPYAYMEGKPGRFDHSVRRIDALVIKPNAKLWAVEIKVSASDMRRELADPAKTETWAQYVHSFYFLVPPAMEQVALAEIPARYGLLVGEKYWTRAVRRPEANPSPRPLPLDTWRRLATALGTRQLAEIDAAATVPVAAVPGGEK